MSKIIAVAQQKGGSGKTTLAVNLAVQFARFGRSVALMDTDPQGSAGRWFMTRLDAMQEPGLEFATASAWGVSYEMRKLSAAHDLVVIDTPPKADSDLRPALRDADLVLIPVASSLVDLWAVEAVLALAAREGVPALIVMTRARPGTRLAEQVAKAAAETGANLAKAALSNRVVYAETLGQGRAVVEAGNSAAVAEVLALAREVEALIET